MAKQKKKRNKVYRGEGASATRPTVTKISAVNRNKASQYMYEKKRIAKPLLIALAVLILIVILLIGIVGLFTGS